MKRGEAWLSDCRLAARVRPVLVWNVSFAETARAVVAVAFNRGGPRGSPFEVQMEVPFLKAGAFIAQSLAACPVARAIGRPVTQTAARLAAVEAMGFK